MGLFDRKKKGEGRSQNKSEETEFERDIIELMGRDDVLSRSEICDVEYRKAMKLLENPTQDTVHRAYDIMGSLASQFDHLPAIMWMADFAESALHRLDQAARWYKRAADLGDGNGARCYADMLMTGRGVETNTQLAMHYYADAADKGVPEAAFVIGEYLRTRGDRDNALKAYGEAASGGYSPAQTRIDQMKRGQI